MNDAFFKVLKKQQSQREIIQDKTTCCFLVGEYSTVYRAMKFRAQSVACYHQPWMLQMYCKCSRHPERRECRYLASAGQHWVSVPRSSCQGAVAVSLTATQWGGLSGWNWARGEKNQAWEGSGDGGSFCYLILSSIPGWTAQHWFCACKAKETHCHLLQSTQSMGANAPLPQRPMTVSQVP